MKIRWTGEPRSLPDPQIDVTAGDIVEVPDDAGASYIEQKLAAKATKKETD